MALNTHIHIYVFKLYECLYWYYSGPRIISFLQIFPFSETLKLFCIGDRIKEAKLLLFAFLKMAKSQENVSFNSFPILKAFTN